MLVYVDRSVAGSQGVHCGTRDQFAVIELKIHLELLSFDQDGLHVGVLKSY